MGTISARCTFDRARRDRIQRIGDQASQAVRDVRQGLGGLEEMATSEMLTTGLEHAWCAWDFSLRHSREFGALSFGLVALCQVLECLERLQPKRKEKGVYVKSDLSSRISTVSISSEIKLLRCSSLREATEYGYSNIFIVCSTLANVINRYVERLRKHR